MNVWVAALNWPVSVPSLTDGTVTLRGWVAQDAGAVHASCQDAEIQRWLDVPVPFSLEDAVDFIVEQRQRWSVCRGASFAIARSIDGEVLGECSLVAVDAERLTAQMTYAVSAFARGQGVAQRAVRLLGDWAFIDVGLRRLEFYIEPDNTASRAVAGRIGCRLEKRSPDTSTPDGGRGDAMLYVLSATQPPTPTSA